MSTTSQASQRIEALLDANSFVEIGARITARATDFNLKQTETPSDGVITGYGVIGGNLVYVYSQDASVLNGSVGEMHAKKIANLYDLALKTGAPVIGLIESAGLRLQEATDALNGFGEIYKKQVLSSGVIPQITAIFGSCGGGLALIPTLTDFTFMESKKAKLFVNAPNTLAGNSVEKLDTASAAFQKTASNVDFVVEGEAELLNSVRELVSILALLISVAPIFSKERDFDYIFFENSLMEGNWYYSFVNYEDPSWVMNINGHLPICEDEFSSAGNSLVLNYITNSEKGWNVKLHYAETRGIEQFRKPEILSIRMKIASGERAAALPVLTIIDNKDNRSKTVALNEYADMSAVGKWQTVTIPVSAFGITTSTGKDMIGKAAVLEFGSAAPCEKEMKIYLDDIEFLPLQTPQGKVETPHLAEVKAYERHFDLKKSNLY